MTPNWTPGPWKAFALPNAMDDDSPQTDNWYCVRAAKWNHKLAVGDANARLIAAAPDLYAALEAALPWINVEHQAQARAALAKARGKP